MGTTVELPSGVVRDGDGMMILTGKAEGLRAEAFTWDGDEQCAFKVTLAKHSSLKADQRALLHGRFDFRGLTFKDVALLAAKFLVFRWVQRDARLVSRLKEVEGRTWVVREFLAMERRPRVVKSADQILAEALENPTSLIAKMTAEQRAALTALLSGGLDQGQGAEAEVKAA